MGLNMLTPDKYKSKSSKNLFPNIGDDNLEIHYD